MRILGGLVVVASSVALGLGCYAPSPTAGLECVNEQCPDGQLCEGGVCVVESTATVDGMPVDAPGETRANLAFLSDVQPNGDLGGRVGADLTCQANAMTAGLPGTFKAFLTIGMLTGDPSTLPRGFVDVRGQLVADEFSDFTNNAMLGPLMRDAYGAKINTIPKVAAGSPGLSCDNWTSTSGSAGVNYAWSPFRNDGVRSISCSSPIRIACLETGHQFPLSVIATKGRVAFVTKSYWQPAGGLAGADSVCQAEAAAADLTGTFKALIEAGITGESNRHPKTGLPWIRPDGARVVATPSDLFDEDIEFIENFISQHADGTAINDSFMVWRGEEGFTCNNWNAPLKDDEAIIGVGPCVQRYCLDDSEIELCTNGARLICLEQ